MISKRQINISNKFNAVVLVLISFTFGCSFINMNVEPIAATITELSACNENGEPTETFLSDEARIFVCGYVETLQPVDIDIHWYYKNKLVFQQSGKDMKGHFYNFVQPGNGGLFQEGHYRIDILIGNVVAKSTEFRVE